jgi:hypothetical protein
MYPEKPALSVKILFCEVPEVSPYLGPPSGGPGHNTRKRSRSSQTIPVANQRRTKQVRFGDPSDLDAPWFAAAASEGDRAEAVEHLGVILFIASYSGPDFYDVFGVISVFLARSVKPSVI